MAGRGSAPRRPIPPYHRLTRAHHACSLISVITEIKESNETQSAPARSTTSSTWGEMGTRGASTAPWPRSTHCCTERQPLTARGHRRHPGRGPLQRQQQPEGIAELGLRGWSCGRRPPRPFRRPTRTSGTFSGWSWTKGKTRTRTRPWACSANAWPRRGRSSGGQSSARADAADAGADETVIRPMTTSATAAARHREAPAEDGRQNRAAAGQRQGNLMNLPRLTCISTASAGCAQRKWPGCGFGTGRGALAFVDIAADGFDPAPAGRGPGSARPRTACHDRRKAAC